MQARILDPANVTLDPANVTMDPGKCGCMCGKVSTQRRRFCSEQSVRSYRNGLWGRSVVRGARRKAVSDFLANQINVIE